MPAHAEAIVQEGNQFLLLQVMTADWRGLGSDRQLLYYRYLNALRPVVYVSYRDYYIVRFEFSG